MTFSCSKVLLLRCAGGAFRLLLQFVCHACEVAATADLVLSRSRGHCSSGCRTCACPQHEPRGAALLVLPELRMVCMCTGEESKGIVVGNAQRALLDWTVEQAQNGRIALADKPLAHGVLEGLARHGLY